MISVYLFVDIHRGNTDELLTFITDEILVFIV